GWFSRTHPVRPSSAWTSPSRPTANTCRPRHQERCEVMVALTVIDGDGVTKKLGAIPGTGGEDLVTKSCPVDGNDVPYSAANPMPVTAPNPIPITPSGPSLPVQPLLPPAGSANFATAQVAVGPSAILLAAQRTGRVTITIKNPGNASVFIGHDSGVTNLT